MAYLNGLWVFLRSSLMFMAAIQCVIWYANSSGNSMLLAPNSSPDTYKQASKLSAIYAVCHHGAKHPDICHTVTSLEFWL
jgi:hypothetical protein